MPLILFSIYLGYLLTIAVPFEGPISDLGLFFVCSLFSFLILSQAKVFKSRKTESKSNQTIYLILTSGLFLSMMGALAGQGSLGFLPQKISQILTSQYSIFVWTVASLLGLIFLKKRRKKKKKKK